MASQQNNQSFLLGVLLATLGVFVIGSSITNGFVSASLLSYFSETFQEEGEGDTSYQDQQQFEEEKKNELNYIGKDRARECKDMTKEVKRIKKKLPNEAQGIESKVKDFCAAIQEGKQCIEKASDREQLQECRDDITQDRINNISGDLWEEINSYSNQLNVMQDLKGIQKRCKEYQRRGKEISREAKRAKVSKEKIATFNAWVDEVVKTCQANLAQVQAYAKKGEWQDAQDLMQETFHQDDTWQQFDEYQETLLACRDISNRVKDVQRDVKETKRFVKSLKREGHDVTILNEIVASADTILKQLKTIQSSEQCDQDAMEDYMSQLEDLEIQFKETVDEIMGNNKEEYEEEFDQGGEEQPESQDQNQPASAF